MADIEEIKSKLDIVDVISSYVPDVKKAGTNYKARCPFHAEKTASFTINPSLQIFKCFGCGKAGDVIKFIEEIEHTDFPDALKIAAEKAGVELTTHTSPQNAKDKIEKEQLLSANLLTAKYYNYIIMQHESGKKGLEYAMEKRKIDMERIKDFMVGFAPNRTNNLKAFLLSKGFNVKDLVRWGLLVERNGSTIDKFRERVIQPIFNLKGEVVAFSGRYIGTVKEAPKYLNSPETLVYKKNEMLYGLYQAREFLRDNNFLIMVEGNIDILSSHKVGVGNIVAPLGTAFTVNQAKLIKRFTENLYFCFDTDEAGLKALIRGMGIAEDIELKHKVIDLTGYQDADELIRNNPEEWPKRIQNAKQTMDYLIEYYRKDIDLGSPEGKMSFETNILPCLALIKDEAQYNYYKKDIAYKLDVSEEFINSKMDKMKKQVQINKKIDVKEDLVEKPLQKKIEINNTEKALLEYLIVLDKFVDLKFGAENFLSDIRILFEIFKLHYTETYKDIAEKYVPEELKKTFSDIMIKTDESEMVNADRESLIKQANALAGKVRKNYFKTRSSNPIIQGDDYTEYYERGDNKRKELHEIDNGTYKIVE